MSKLNSKMYKNKMQEENKKSSENEYSDEVQKDFQPETPVKPDVFTMIGAVNRNLLRAVSVTVTQSAGRKRGPPRLLGKTKSQYLDWLMRSNANICALISFSFFPIVAWYSYRYITVLKPARDAKAAQEKEDLLSEGKATA